MEKQPSISIEALAKGFRPLDSEAFKHAVCEVMGSCATRSLESYKDAILAAAGCVEHHFGLSAEKVGVPLVTFQVAGFQVGGALTNELDPADATRWANAGSAQFDLYAKAIGITDAEQRDRLWNFTLGQAVAVLRGEFDGRSIQ